MAKHKYISLDDAIKLLRKAETGYRKTMVSQVRADMIAHCIKLICELPAADVVEVVRCKDCRWWTKQEKSLQGRCELAGFYPTGEWFCANGERSNCGTDMREVTPCSS